MTSSFVKTIQSASGPHAHRFASARHITQMAGGVPAALLIQNSDSHLQSRIHVEIERRLPDLEGMRHTPSIFRVTNPESSLKDAAKGFFESQQAIMEMGNRFGEDEFTPVPLAEMLPFTQGMLGKDDSRKGQGSLFESPAHFLELFDRGLAMCRDGQNGLASVGLLLPGGGAALRAAAELPNYPDYTARYGVTAATPRNLYPIMNTQTTFLDMAVTLVGMMGEHLGVNFPVSLTSSFASAPHYVDHIRKGSALTRPGVDVGLWNQRTVQRYDLAQFPEPLDGNYPPGHGDIPVLGYHYGLLHAWQGLGIKSLVNGNSDEFLWLYVMPALLAKMTELESHMFAIGVENTNNQMGGVYGNGEMVETPRIPFSYVAKKKAPPLLNTTFVGMSLDHVLRGAPLKFIEDETGKIYLVTKPTWVDREDGQRFVNVIGADYWMGDEFSQAVKAGGGTFKVFQAPRNLFLGIKGPQQAANTEPEKFLSKLSYSSFYTMMAEKAPRVLDVLLRGKPSQRLKLAEQLFKNNFELIGVKI